MKAIMKSEKPKVCVNILNGDQSLIVSRNCPKDWKDYLSGKTNVKPKPIEVYIHCNNDKKDYVIKEPVEKYPFGLLYWEWILETKDYLEGLNPIRILNGKVVAKFTLNKVELVSCCSDDFNKITKASSCITMHDLINYCEGKDLYAWHIDNLVIFDTPKYIDEFEHPKPSICGVKDDKGFLYQCDKCKYSYSEFWHCEWRIPLTKSPKNYCYIEVEE